MKSEEIEQGDVLLDADGNEVYRVLTVREQRPHIVAQVQFIDGGSGNRMFERGVEVPLVRP